MNTLKQQAAMGGMWGEGFLPLLPFAYEPILFTCTFFTVQPFVRLLITILYPNPRMHLTFVTPFVKHFYSLGFQPSSPVGFFFVFFFYLTVCTVFYISPTSVYHVFEAKTSEGGILGSPFLSQSTANTPSHPTSIISKTNPESICFCQLLQLLSLRMSY